jgi:hypothetical protein
MTEQQSKMLEENNQLLKTLKSTIDKHVEEYETFKKSTGFDPSDDGGCPKL